MAEILPRDLSAVPSVNPSSAIIVDDGNIVGKGTPLQVVDAARPKASQVDAEAGADNEKIMTPLRVKQAIDAQADVSLRPDLASSDLGKGAGLLADQVDATGAVPLTQHQINSEAPSVKRFGATGDGVSNDTAAVILANAFTLTIVFPAGGTYNLQNWTPRAGTRIIATGATINRYNDDTYAATGSSAAVVITNDDIEIVGGTWGISALATKALAWSGSVLVEDGSAVIHGNAKFTGSWGAVFGHEVQNGTKVCSYLAIDGCELVDNSHNTYLADIDNLSFTNNRSHGSSRDGLRAYRNVQNLIITENHLYDNGDGTVGQSQDGMDLFFGGKRCIIVGNYIYGNSVKGIDIKRGLAAEGEAVQGERFIIQGNHIFDNGHNGIEFAQSQTVPAYNENIQVIGNQIYGNGQRGITADYCKNLIVSANIIHGNANGGMRWDNVIVGRIADNVVYDNSGIGILVQPTCSNIEVTGNASYDGGASTQTGGINISCSGRCHENDVYGNTNYQIASTVRDGTLKGETITARVASAVSGLQYIGSLDCPGVVTGAKVSANAGTTADILLAKRNATTGAYVGPIYSNTTEALTGNLPASLTGGTWNASNAILAPNELTYLVVNSASNAFTMGLIELEVIT